MSKANYILLMLMFPILLSGCGVTLGVKEKVIPVYVTLGQHEEAHMDLIRVATNKKIPVTVGDYETKLDVGGYIVVHPQDLKAYEEAIKDTDGR